jgi:hypothetical protein
MIDGLGIKKNKTSKWGIWQNKVYYFFKKEKEKGIEGDGSQYAIFRCLFQDDTCYSYSYSYSLFVIKKKKKMINTLQP